MLSSRGSPCSRAPRASSCEPTCSSSSSSSSSSITGVRGEHQEGAASSARKGTSGV